MPASPRRCYLHIGPPKTGTSFLQSVLWASRDELANQGVGLLMDRQVEHYALTLAIRQLLREPMDPPAWFEAPERLRESAARSTAPRTLITHESLGAATPTQVAGLIELLPGYEIHVVVTARDLARQVASGWQQRIQGRQVHGYDEFLEAVVGREPLAHDFWANQDLVGVLDNWGTAVPAERMHIVTVPPAGSPPGLLLDRFCSVVEVEPGSLSRDAPTPNTSLGLVQAELLRRVNLELRDRLTHSRKGYAKVGQTYLAGQILTAQKGAPPKVPRRLAAWCDGLAEETVDRLEQGRYRIVGDLTDLLPREETYGEDVEIGDAEIGSAAVAALADILDARHHEIDERARLRTLVRQTRADLRQTRRSLERATVTASQAGASAGARLDRLARGAVRRVRRIAEK